jgi:tRNA(Ile2) C34 agmatinyltransferase TiaS
MAKKRRVCPECDADITREDFTCPECGARIRYKTTKEAYSWGGLGLFDLIPGIRDLPFPARLTSMIVVVTLLVGGVTWFVMTR